MAVRKKVQRTIVVDQYLFSVANFYGAQTGVDIHLLIQEGLRDYVKKSQEDIGVPASFSQEEMEARYKRDPGRRQTRQEGLLYEMKIDYDLFVNVIFYATQEGLTLDLLVEKILLDRIEKAQQKVGYFSDGEIAERYKRERERFLKEMELKVERKREADRQEVARRKKEAKKHQRKMTDWTTE